jgi:hypothetical protein
MSRHPSAPTPQARKTRACDACHASKTKCDGDSASGFRCSLCTKRGVQCAFPPGPSASAQPHRGALSTAKGRSESEGADDCVLDDSSQDVADDENESMIDRSRATSQRGMVCILKLIPLVDSLPALDEVPAIRGLGLKPWVEECQKSYFETFHERWPVLFGSDVQLESEAFCVGVTVVIIGLWSRERHDADGRVRSEILKAHEMLVDEFLLKLVSSLGRKGLSWLKRQLIPFRRLRRFHQRIVGQRNFIRPFC